MQHSDVGMNERAKTSPPASFDDAELWALERRWYDGQLLGHVEALIRFTQRHRERILAWAGHQPSAVQLLEAIKAVIEQSGTIDASSELRDQAREIKDEIWYRGEKGDFDRRKIQLEWTERHAASWRQWRLKEYLFVADRCGHQLQRALHSSATGTGR